jgi:hypothetical protein
MAQTRPAAEVVVIDDGSTDPQTRSVLAELAQRGGLRVIRTSNRGLAAARNTGVEETSAPYIVALDADDELDPEYLEKTASRLDAESSLGFVTTGMQAFGAASYVWIPPECSVRNALVRGTAHASTMFRRSMWEILGGFSPDSPGCEDLDFFLTAMIAGHRGAVVQEPLLRYRIQAGSMHQAAVARGTIVDSMRALFVKHQKAITEIGPELLVEKDLLRFELEGTRHHLRDRVAEARQSLAAADEEVRDLLSRDPSQARVEWGDLDRHDPLSGHWGFDRGTAVDRHYIVRFLKSHRFDVRGRVLEVKDQGYARQFGGGDVTDIQVIDVDPANPQATIVADLSAADALEANQFDCFILTQTLHIIYDIGQAAAHAIRVLKPGGVLLCTIPAVSRVNDENGGLESGDYWRLTQAAVWRLFASLVPPERVRVETYGNVRTCAAFLYGVAAEELPPETLDHHDPWFPLVHCIRVVKPL